MLPRTLGPHPRPPRRTHFHPHILALPTQTLGYLSSLRSAFLDLLSAGAYASRSLLIARLRVVGEPSISSL